VARISSGVFNTVTWAFSFVSSARNFSWPSTAWPGYVALPQLRAINSTAGFVGVRMCRCAADDAALSTYMGPPPCALPAIGATGTIDPGYSNGTA
jgi:hypothetical protein